ncbi:MAG TPA: MMPL family transporter [Solirubrobacteraceae bacterium]|nr:MMPL family transporter [Solirubrobacteraceae bacterium]
MTDPSHPPASGPPDDARPARTGAPLGAIDRAFAGLARATVALRWPLIALWLVLAVAVPQLLPSLSSQIRSQNADFLPSGTPSLHGAQLAAPFQSRTALSTVLVAGRASSPLTAADDARLTRVESTLARDRAVLDVRDQGISRDGRARRVLIEFRSGLRFDNAEKTFTRLRGVWGSSATPGGLRMHLAGRLAQSVDKRTQDAHNRSLTSQLSILFILTLLLVVFRAALAPFITLIPAGLSVLIAGPLIGAAAEAGVEVSGLTQILLTVIVLGAGTDYGLFLIYRVREEMARGSDARTATTFALSRVGETITFSAACVIFALLSVVLADFGLYRGLGPGLAIGIAVVLLAGLTLLPALLAVFGRAAFWPSRPRPGHQYRGAWGGVAARVVGRPRGTLLIGLAVFVGLALALLAYKPAGFGAENAPTGSDSAQGDQLLKAHFPLAARNPTNVIFRLRTPVWADPAPLAAMQRGLQGSVPFTSVVGPLNPNGVALTPAQLIALHDRLGAPQALGAGGRGRRPVAGVTARLLAAYRAESQFISADGRTVQAYVTLRAGDPASTEALHAVPEQRQAVDAVAASIGASDHGETGEAPVAYDVSQISTRDLRRIVPVVLAIIALLLAVLLRSLVAPLYLIVSVGLSYLAALGLAIVVFIGLGGDAGLNFVLPFFMFVFLMALGSDYNILVMTRIREEAHSWPLPEAVRRAIAATGGTVTSAGLVLAGTFAVLTATGDSQAQEIGLGLAAGILLDTFLVRTLLIPSAVVIIGRWNWWPSQLARRPDRSHNPGRDGPPGLDSP